MPRWIRRGRLLAARTFASAAVCRPFDNICRPRCWTRCTWPSGPSCSDRGSISSPTSICPRSAMSAHNRSPASERPTSWCARGDSLRRTTRPRRSTRPIAKLAAEVHPYRPHPWHGLEVGPDPPEVLNAYIEITPFDLMKYEVDKVSGYLRVDRPQRSSAQPPALYGFVPRTYCDEHVRRL